MNTQATKYSSIVLLLCTLVSAILLSGCQTGYHSRDEVISTLQEAFPNERIVVSQKFETGTTEQGGPEHIWTAYFENLPDVTFTIHNSFDYVGERSSYSLWFDADVKLLQYYLKQYNTSSGNMNAWTPPDSTGAILEGTYCDMASLTALAEQAAAFDTYLSSHAPLPRMSYCAKFSDLSLENYLFDGRIQERSGTELLAAGKEDLKDYYAFFQMPSPDFTSEELASYAKERWNLADQKASRQPLIQYTTGEQLPMEKLQGVPIETNGRTFGYISFGGLYYLLERLECSPQGDASHFKVLGTDGIWYEFSYSFYHAENSKEIEQAYYYLCDGDEVPLWETMLSLQDDRDLLVDVTGLLFTLT